MTKKTVRERSDAICARHNISKYRLAKLLRMRHSAFDQDTEGSQPMDWLLLRIEEEGLEYFERKEIELGVFGKRRE